MNKLLISAFIFILSSSFVFASERSAQTTISELQAYPEYGNGDVIFKISVPSEICKGYWLSPSTPGFKANLSLLLSAFHTSTNVVVHGLSETGNKWSGSGTHFCKLYTVQLTK